MQDQGNHRVGIFTPEEVQEMQDELNRSTTPGESETERLDRALEIIHRKDAERPGG